MNIYVQIIVQLDEEERAEEIDSQTILVAARELLDKGEVQILADMSR